MSILGFFEGGGSAAFSLVVWAVGILSSWFLFEKAGEPGWMSIIPGLGIWKMFEIVYGAGWKCLLLLVPVLNLVVLIAFCFRLPQAYGKEGPYMVVYGFATLFFSPIVYAVLAFHPNTLYSGPCYKFL